MRAESIHTILLNPVDSPASEPSISSRERQPPARVVEISSSPARGSYRAREDRARRHAKKKAADVRPPGDPAEHRTGRAACHSGIKLDRKPGQQIDDRRNPDCADENEGRDPPARKE